MFFIYYVRINLLRLALNFRAKVLFLFQISKDTFLGGRKQVKTKEEKRSIKEKEMNKKNPSQSAKSGAK